MEKKRLFCAIQVPPLQQLLEYRDKVKSVYRLEKVHWTKDENFHITLMFMGPQPVSLLPNIKEVVARATSDQKVFELPLQNIRLFGYSYAPSIIYVGAEHPTLHTLSEKIHNGVAPLGIEGQNPRYTPHLTLGRIRTNRYYKKEKEELARYNDQFIVNMQVSSVYLYASTFTSQGMQYDLLESFPLLGNNDRKTDDLSV